MPASPIRKLVPFAEAAKKKGVHVYHLNIGQPDIETPHIMMEAVQHANLKVLEYTDSRGILSLRKNTQHISKATVSWIPLPPLDRIWNDEDIYKYYKLTNDERSLINKNV